MSDPSDLSSRLKALEDDFAAPKAAKPNSPLLVLGIVGAAAVVGAGVYFALSGPETTPRMATQSAQDFQIGGSAFGDMDMARRDPPPAPAPAAAPEPETPSEMTALLEQLATMQAELAALRDAPAPADDGRASELSDLQRQIHDMQAAADQAGREAQEAARRLDRELLERNREITRLESELQMARLSQPPAQIAGDTRDLEREELERRRAAAEEARLARLNSPMLAIGGRGGSGGAESAQDASRLDDNEEFVRSVGRPAPVERASVIVNPANTVTQGSVIQASLETAIDSSLPGPIRAVVTQDVHSYDGTRILIPRGSRLIGRYSANVSIGQYRAMVAWERIILPDNQTVTISAYGGDAIGRSGVSGRVNRRFGERFGAAALISLLSSGPALAAREMESDMARDGATRVSGDLRDATGSVVSEYLSLPPIITIDQGARVTVMVDRDLEIF
ncbi:TrbI/VirB10 family protein [Roseinatronobacter sp. NSM]|uniref:TrbI/VirB10 family protein n=1 Tax=Roseinatronobacter sp. NSM TaxID=3457785 RepID=UPI004035E78F